MLIAELSSNELNEVSGGSECTQDLATYATGVALIVASGTGPIGLGAALIVVGAYTAYVGASGAGDTCS